MNPLVIVAHGTRDEAGAAVVGELAAAVQRRLPDVPVRTAFVDVRPPRLATALAEVLCGGAQPGPAVVVPAFLGAGYHVRTDLPGQISDAGFSARTLVTPLLGADPLLVTAAEDRVRRAGWRPGDVVLLGAAGSRDQRALVDIRAAADALGARLGTEVGVGYLASGEPRLADLVASLRSDRRSAGVRPAAGRSAGRAVRVVAASWLMAPGLFQRRLSASGADIVTDPLGVHPAVVDAVVSRYRRALAPHADPGPADPTALPGRRGHDPRLSTCSDQRRRTTIRSRDRDVERRAEPASGRPRR